MKEFFENNMSKIYWVLCVIFLIVCWNIYKSRSSLGDDSPLEEKIESVIHDVSGKEIDLTPLSPEK